MTFSTDGQQTNTHHSLLSIDHCSISVSLFGAPMVLWLNSQHHTHQATRLWVRLQLIPVFVECFSREWHLG